MEPIRRELRRSELGRRAEAQEQVEGQVRVPNLGGPLVWTQQSCQYRQHQCAQGAVSAIADDDNCRLGHAVGPAQQYAKMLAARQHLG